MRQIMKNPGNTALNGADYTRTIRRMVVPNSMTMEEVSIPGNWANVFSKVKADDEVIVPEDRSWRLHLLVIETGVGWVKNGTAACDRSDQGRRQAEAGRAAGEIPDDAPAPPAGYTVNFAPAHKWRAMTSDPHLVVSKDHKTRADAIKAAHEHAAKAQGSPREQRRQA
jgi:hypothetical protein